MYSVNVTQFYDPDSDFDTLISDSTNDNIKEYIAKKICKSYTGTTRDYLLYCAEWHPQPHNERLWIAYSPITNNVNYPLSSINLTYSHETLITYNFEFVSVPQKMNSFQINNLPEGNLPTHLYGLKKEKNNISPNEDVFTYDIDDSGYKNFKGTISIRLF